VRSVGRGVAELRFVMAYEGLLNVSSLNLERVAEIRKMPVIYWENGRLNFIPEVPAISGVMLKHWHFRNLVELSRGNDNLCFFCNQLQAIRIPPRKVQNYYRIEYKKQEIELITSCVGEDVHGFLVTEEKEALRRESCVWFSWAIGLPKILEKHREEECKEKERMEEYRRIIVVQHSRNVSKIPSEDEIKEQVQDIQEKAIKDIQEALSQLQMVYPRPYASDFYGFVSVANLSRIGVSYTDIDSTGNLKKIDPNVKRKRQKNTILAYARMIQGEVGANLARSLPASIPITVFLAASKKGMIPAPVHPIYPNYLIESAKLIKGAADLFGDEYRVRIYAPRIDENVKKEITNILNDTAVFVDDPYKGFKDIISFLGLEECTGKQQ
jgi:CRISPR-associated protein Cst2